MYTDLSFEVEHKIGTKLGTTLFLPISIQSNLGFNLELYFISSIDIYIFFFSRCVFDVGCAVLELETLFLLIWRLKELLDHKERRKY